MAPSSVHRLTSLVMLLAVMSSAKDKGRWSRQISSYTSDIGDWVPLSAPVEREPPLPPIKRQAVAEPRILTEPFPGLPRPTGFSSDIFPSRAYINAPANRQLYLQSMPAVPSAPQNYLTDQGFGQSIRFGLSQPNFPLNQGFLSPQFGYESVPQNIPQIKPKPQATSNPIKFENFQKNTPFQVPMTTQVKAFNNQPSNTKPEVPKFIDGYRAENASNDFVYSQKKKPQSLQKIKFENYEKPMSRPEILQNVPKPQQPNQKLEREEVQLLYVPLESLNRGQFNFRSPLSSSQLLNTDLYSQGVPQTSYKKSMTELYRPIQQTAVNPIPQNYFSEFNSQLHSLQQQDLDQVPKFSTLTIPSSTSSPTTIKPKKLKPHQPPLAIFLTEEASKNNQIKVGDVLASLKTQNSVAVLDSVNPLNAPKVFIGPSSLQPPERYVKFELPYLSNIENSDKKLRQLPFFVAPLSYNTPQGFAKIPFLSPHVGSVVINSQIRETSTQGPSTENVNPSYYTGAYRQEQKPVTQKPTVSFYTTAAPKTNLPSTYQSNYYQFEPQTVSTLRPLKEPDTVGPVRPGSYFLSNNAQYNAQYNPSQYELAPQNNYQNRPEPEPVKPAPKVETTTSPRTTVSTTTKLPSTYPSQLLETHNPYSINQAFHFSTPLDYRTYIDEFKVPVATPIANDPLSTPQRPVSTTSQTPRVEEVATEQQRYQQQTSPQYQSYSPEIQYESDVQNSRYPVYNTNDYPTKTETAEPYNPIQFSRNTEFNPPASNNSTEYTENKETQAPTQNTVQNETPTEQESKLPTVTEVENPTKYEYNQYETSFDSSESQTSSTTSTTTTTTTTRRPLRGRGRPRYTTTPRTESGEYSTRSAVTHRPLRERRPLPTRPRYEQNKITTEKTTRKPIDYSEESTTKSSRTRIRGRVTYKPTEEVYDRKRTHNSKEQDLAYQRDVLHQNYPVTIQERSSTIDIEAITEPTQKLSSTNVIEPNTDTYDTENAYTYERATISQQNPNPDSNEDIPVFPSRTTVAQTETSYVPRLSTRNEEYMFHSRSSIAPVESISYDETPGEKEEENNMQQTTPVHRKTETVAFVTETTSTFDENKEQTYSENEENHYREEETTTTTPEVEVTKEVIQETGEEENVVQTTPSYNRVRVRPGVIKQYHQASTETSRVKNERRRPVTYRPAFDKRRTTMRIDEIQQDLKTKQVNGRAEFEDYRHPVYKPEQSSEATSTQEATTKRGSIRRRRPGYSYTTTEGSPTKQNTYEVKNRFRGRRPTTEKPTEKTEVPSDASTTTLRPLYSRYSHRPRLSERYNKKPESETEETEDQDSNFSINRPTYTEPDTVKWSPKIASDSFKPYNPNNIADEEKAATTERRSDKIEMDIITAKNEFEDLLISVTPATNNRNNKKIPEIPPTLEALVEQSKVTKSDVSDNMSTFESMLEEVMKSLEEQDEDEYSSNVMKHKGGEIGEIPPERVISSEDSYNTKATLPITQETTTLQTTAAAADDFTTNQEENNRKSHRRGFWKKVKVRPVATESIEAAESQYYPSTVNRLGQPMKSTKSSYDKSKYEKKVSVTTYKPNYQFMKDIFSSDDITANEEVIPTVEISKVSTNTINIEKETDNNKTTEAMKETLTEKTELGPGDFDLGTGSPDPTIDNFYSTPTEPTTVKTEKPSFSFMDYLFGTTAEDDSKTEVQNDTTTTQIQTEITTELAKSKMPTTESTFIPDEMTDSIAEEVTETIEDLRKVDVTTPKEDTTTTELPKIETSSQSSFMNPANVISTSMSTEISHETEICFRGKCIKTFKDVI